MNEELSDLPHADGADPDGVQVALRAAHTLWSRGDTTESLKWLRKAAESASDEGADLRSLQLAKAAAELRAKLFASNEAPRPPASSEISGAHPIAGGEGELLRAAASLGAASSLASASQGSGGVASPGPVASAAAEQTAASGGAAARDAGGSQQQPVVTATQYPSHRPRQRMGLRSSSFPPPPSERLPSDDEAYAAGLPAWLADSERRLSAAPPPLPALSIDDYEELEAEPDDDPDQPGDDPASIWSGSAPDSWRSAEQGSDGAPQRHVRASAVAPASALPPPLPPRSAFEDDELEDDGQLPDPPTRVMPPLDESDGDGRSGYGERDRGLSDSFNVPGSAWDQQSRAPAAGAHWEGANGAASWGNELRGGGWGSSPSNETASEAALSPSEAGRAKLTARVHHQAVRVSFAPDQRVPGQFVVRALREGERAAAGERVALLVALEPGTPLV